MKITEIIYYTYLSIGYYSLMNNKWMQFTTKDRDQDDYRGNYPMDNLIYWLWFNIIINA